MTKALFFDVDGTLIDGKHGVRYVYPEVVAELERIHEQGHKIFLATGRPHKMVSEPLWALPVDGAIMANGGHVQLGGTTIHQELMGFEAAHAAVDLLASLGIEYTIDTAHHVYIRREFTQLRAFFSHHPEIFTFDFDENDALARAIKIEAYPSDEMREVVRAMAAEQIGPSVFCGDNGTGMTFEMYSPRLSKVTGVARALASAGISRQDSYAFGDGANDLDMLVYCGCGVAMGNAVDVLKEAADIVCGPINEGGLAQALRELF